jgi:hypothetical protein
MAKKKNKAEAIPELDVLDVLQRGIESQELPSLENIAASLSKKAFKQYDALISEPAPFAALVQLANQLEKSDSLEFGFAKIYQPMLCYALAATIAAPAQRVDIYSQIIRMAEDAIFKADMEDPRINAIIDFALTEKKVLQESSPVDVTGLEANPELAALVQQSHRLENEILGVRLDMQYQILQQCISSVERSSSLDTLQENAENFLKSVLDVESMVDVHKAMAKRAASHDPEYIPGINPENLTRTIDPNSATTKARFNLQRLAQTALGVEHGNLLTVNAGHKKNDEEEQVVMMNKEQRDELRVLIKAGKFIERMPDNNFRKVDTDRMTSHGKDGFAAFVMNTRGEISIFTHYGAEKAFAHSSPNAQAAVQGAGELKIEGGKLTQITTYSGHYRPDLNNVLQTLEHFQKMRVDIANVVVHLAVATPEGSVQFKKFNAIDLMQNREKAVEITGEAELTNQDNHDNSFAADFSNNSGAEFDADFADAPASQTEFSSASSNDDWAADFSTNSDDFAADSAPNSPAPETDDWAADFSNSGFATPDIAAETSVETSTNSNAGDDWEPDFSNVASPPESPKSADNSYLAKNRSSFFSPSAKTAPVAKEAEFNNDSVANNSRANVK